MMPFFVPGRCRILLTTLKLHGPQPHVPGGSQIPTVSLGRPNAPSQANQGTRGSHWARFNSSLTDAISKPLGLWLTVPIFMTTRPLRSPVHPGSQLNVSRPETRVKLWTPRLYCAARNAKESEPIPLTAKRYFFVFSAGAPAGAILAPGEINPYCAALSRSRMAPQERQTATPGLIFSAQTGQSKSGFGS